MINLVKDTIDKEDVGQLIEWLKTNPRLTKGELTIKFEEEWSRWIGRRYSVFVNSGSSANLLAAYALIEGKFLKNNRVVIPTLSWATTVAPYIQFGYEPIICDVEMEGLGTDPDCLESVFKKMRPAVLMAVNVLGFPNKYKEIGKLCEKYGVIMIEDSCETYGSTYSSTKEKCGTFGLMSTFSFYFGHTMSTIEGGMISTDNKKVYDLLKMLRSHGWDRDLDSQTQRELREEHNVEEFKSLYTFYYPGFNLRATDLQAKIGLQQMKKLDSFCQKRFENYNKYQERIKNFYWKPDPESSFVANMAYPIISPRRDCIVRELRNNKIECRPLICGAMSKQPFIRKQRDLKCFDQNADKIDNYGMYIPNHPYLTEEEMNLIIDTVNEVIKK